MSAQSSSTPSKLALPVETARRRIDIGPPPEWSQLQPFSAADPLPPPPPARPADHLTWLLIDRQIHAASSQTLSHTIVRLETMQAVQHRSQWRLQFEPHTQRITLHKLVVHRGAQTFDHTNLAKIHLLQREEGLESFVLHGCFTLLVVLDDIRPGDIIESAHTLEHRPHILPDNCFDFFNLPSASLIHRHRFTVTFPAARPLRWKTSAPDLAPAITHTDPTASDASTCWTWTGENTTTPEIEPGTPAWMFPAPWIQISDVNDWSAIARAAHDAWPVTPDAGNPGPASDPVTPTAFAQLLAEINAPRPDAHDASDPAPDLATRVERALRLVQDEHRYLSINTELGGYIPAPPNTVAQRRFGDCKDLTLLLVSLLRHLGLAARPILVSTELGNALPDLLPSPGFFNHVIAEFTLDGVTRWVDSTLSLQGGGPLHRPVPPFITGLPVCPDSPGLIPPPAPHTTPAVPEEIYDQHETFLIDTAGRPSFIENIIRATGVHAERLRNQLKHAGEEALAKDHLNTATTRYGNVTRLTPLAIRDTRETNEFVIAETFAAPGLVTLLPGTRLCRFVLPPPLLCTALLMPETDRRGPLQLPCPLTLKHTQELRTPVAPPQGHDIKERQTTALYFHAERRGSRGGWEITSTLSTRAGHVPAADLPAHRELLDYMFKESNWTFTLQAGHPRPHRPLNFGQLPRSSADTARTIETTRSPFAATTATTAPFATASPFGGGMRSADDFKRPRRQRHGASGGGGASVSASKLQTASTSSSALTPATAPDESRRRGYRHGHHRPSKWPIALLLVLTVGALLGLVWFWRSIV
ncbi:DUF3857 domain-containing protein [Geminisphaera colitermitum]|uniref:DUF3857 domain-containing protein n=1 Tax=Geminisphaera colitermitum TaxID=1148786 RepID=UPI0006931D68|nr:DUF3857 domain-containing protein [Geminisphaera colitermitum]